MSSRLANLPDESLERGCNVMRELIGQAHELQALLMSERSALEEKASVDLVQIVKHKQVRLKTLESAFEREAHLIEQLHARTNGRQLHGCNLSKQPQRLLTLWAELCTLLRRCRQQNNANGELIRVLRCHTSGMLSLLQGTLPGNDIYDGSGKRCSSTLSSYSNTA